MTLAREDAPVDLRLYDVLRLPWVPVRLASGEQTRLSLQDTLLQAHQIADLGAALTPLDRDTLLRFLPTVAALVLREVEDDDDRRDTAEEGTFPPEAVAAFVERWQDYFWLCHPEHPFMQRWDLQKSDLDAWTSSTVPLVSSDPGRKGLLRTLGQLHPHTPGGSSARWGIRRDARDPAVDLGDLSLLLTVTWWQTRRGNGKGPDGRALQNGNPGQAGVRPMSVFWVGDSLGATICANTPVSWVEDDNDQLPMWLDQRAEPTAASLAGDPESLWRTTYARNLPFVYFDDLGQPRGYVLGPTNYPVPSLGPDEKSSLSLMHDRDYARLFAEQARKGEATTTRQVSSLGARLSSTEGYTRWYRRRLDLALTQWGGGRLIEPQGPSRWSYGVYGEVCHTTGSREWSDWAVLRSDVLRPDGEVALRLQTLFGLIEQFRGAMYSPMRIACEGRGGKQAADPVLLESTQTAFYAEVEKTVAHVLVEVTVGEAVNWNSVANDIRRLASRVFRDSTECLTAPTTIPQVSVARSKFDSRVTGITAKYYPEGATPALAATLSQEGTS